MLADTVEKKSYGQKSKKCNDASDHCCDSHSNTCAKGSLCSERFYNIC